jgi:hypothetical protein
MNPENEVRMVEALERIASALEKKNEREKKPALKSSCKYCGAEIEWAKYGKKTWPINPDGSRHHCKEYEESKKAEGAESPREDKP